MLSRAMRASIGTLMRIVKNHAHQLSADSFDAAVVASGTLGWKLGVRELDCPDVPRKWSQPRIRAMPIRLRLLQSVLGVLAGSAILAPLAAQSPPPPPLLPEPVVRALAAEVSGTAARRTVQELTLHHRMRGSRGFRAAAEGVSDRLEADGLADVEILALPADGKIFYGTQRSRPAWDADFAELWEQDKGPGGWQDAMRVASWEARPVTLAQDSASGDV